MKIGATILSLLLVGILFGVTHLLHVEECCEETYTGSSEQSQPSDSAEHNCATCYACHPKVDLKRVSLLVKDAPRPAERKEVVNITLLPQIYIEGPSEPPKFSLS